MLYEIHMLKNYPPTNLNRDDTGSPKTCVFGGVTRGRISSQCLKRSWRKSDLLQKEVGAENFGIRTRRLPDLVAERLLKDGAPADQVDAIKPILVDFVKKEKTSEKEDESEKKKESEKVLLTKQIIFYSAQDIESIVNTVRKKLENCKTVKDIKKIKVKDLQDALSDMGIPRPVTLDIALFGRMVTSDAFRDVEASMQVAHAISTNKVTVESDYFTAMDDLLDGGSMDEQGAGMIGDIDYNASCYYLYASLDTDALHDALKDADNADEIIAAAVPALLRTMAFSNPGGKQNSFAGHVLPSCFMVECKEKKIPTSMVNAFVEPVKGSDIVKESIQKLANETDMFADNFGLPVKERLWFCVDKYQISPHSASRVCKTFPELVEAAADLLK